MPLLSCRKELGCPTWGVNFGNVNFRKCLLLAKCVPHVPDLFQWGRRPDQQTRSVRTGNDEQADHDQGKSEGGEERALSCSAEDPGETGGEGEIWSELRTLTFLILLFSLLNSTRTTPLHQSQCMFCYVMPLSLSI